MIPGASDKDYYHGFTPYYEKYFATLDPSYVAEFGVFQGDSIRYLLKRFPKATVYGADIIEPQESWPVDDRFVFVRLDQADAGQVRDFVNRERFDLIIEDGSHHPEHQATCLIEGMRALAPGGLFILEDIHTSFLEHVMSWFGQSQRTSNAFNILMAIDHYMRTRRRVDAAAAARIAQDSLFTDAEVYELAGAIATVSLFRRNFLPDRCWSCGSQDYDYRAIRCLCGERLFKPDDSMSFIIRKGD